MKRKPVLISLLLALLACVLALSVSAISGSSSDEFGEVTVIEGMTSQMTDRDAKVVLANADGTYSTYYAYYIYPTKAWNNAMKHPNFNALNGATGESYDSSDIIRIELLSDCTAFELPDECKTTLKELIFPDDISFTKLPRTYFKGLERVYISSAFTSIDGNTFRDTTALKEVIFSDGFAVTSLPSGMFINCPALEEIKIPNCVTSLGGSMFADCTSLKKIYIGENTGSIGTANLVNAVDNIEMIYMSSKISAFYHNSFTYGSATPAALTLFYVGTLDEATALKANSTHSAVKNATLVAWDSTKPDSYYQTAKDSTAWTVVYNYSPCNAFYDGIHISDPNKTSECAQTCKNCGTVTLKENPKHSLSTELLYENGYAASGVKTVACLNAGCPLNTNPEATLLDAIFDGFRYSTKENDGKLCAMVLTYNVNTAALRAYEQGTGKVLSYGVLAVAAHNVSASPLENDGTPRQDDLVAVDVTGAPSVDLIIKGSASDWDAVIDNETGITVKDLPFYILGYVVEAEDEDKSLSYFYGEKSSKTLTDLEAKSYKDILAKKITLA